MIQIFMYIPRLHQSSHYPCQHSQHTSVCRAAKGFSLRGKVWKSEKTSLCGPIAQRPQNFFLHKKCTKKQLVLTKKIDFDQSRAVPSLFYPKDCVIFLI